MEDLRSSESEVSGDSDADKKEHAQRNNAGAGLSEMAGGGDAHVRNGKS